MTTPFFSIVTVARNDAWAMTKTARSVFRQRCRDREYLVLDGASDDGTPGLIDFWRALGLVDQGLSERDEGVYDAMNKALRMARGEVVCFLNAGDVFAADDVLDKARGHLERGALDGVLGWGELNGQVWASWIADEAFKLASLGFCHQALFVRRRRLLEQPFDARKGRTDSDTLQLGRLCAAGARIAIVPEVWAVRGGEPGISANLELTRQSIVRTLVEEYPALDEARADAVIAFRRQCQEPARMQSLLARSEGRLARHLACMVLDTLCLRQSRTLDDAQALALYDGARAVLARDGEEQAAEAVDRLLDAQTRRAQWLSERAAAAQALKTEVATFERQEQARIARLRQQQPQGEPADLVVSLTSFPARIPTLHLVIQSLVEQTRPPREIHVWLGSDEVPSRQWLPRALLQFESRGLQVHFARRTCHQYDKFLHNAALNAGQPFVIVDDDVIYPPDSIEQLLAGHAAHPQAIVANRCHRIGLRDDGSFAPYEGWQREVQAAAPGLLPFPTGAGGVLYPPGFLSDPRMTRTEDVLTRAPYADDIWLKCWAIARGVATVTTPLSQGARWYLRYTPTMRQGALHATNVDLGLNDRQLERMAAWLDELRPDWRASLLAEAATTC